jgi:hypothetical protein
VLAEGLTTEGLSEFRETMDRFRATDRELAALRKQRASLKSNAEAVDREIAELVRGHWQQLLPYGAVGQLALDQAVDVLGEEACNLLREVFGDPLHPISITAAWRDPAIQELAAAVHGDPRQPLDVLDPRRLAALSRALEGAESDNAEVLSHLRGPGPHVRGCWAVDAILGKE